MNPQALDDPDLLDLMMQDAAQASPLYRPASTWSLYEEQFLPELQRQGLRDFRRRRGSVLSRFGATDLEPRFATVELARSRLFQNRFTPWIPGWSAFRSWLNALLNQPGFSPIEPDLYGCAVEDLKRTAYELVRLLGERVGARPIADLDVSLIGNPEDAFQVDGRFYTMRTLYYYLRYLYCCRFLEFGGIRILAELGSGSGKQIEVLRKLHPTICFLVFDIPPQLYVAEQYLDAVFPGSVVSYRKTRNGSTALDVRPGAILMFGTWKFQRIEEHAIDLFWSAISFQEMEAEVTANYLEYVNRCARVVYLQQRMSGPAPKKHGVMRTTTLEDYRVGLKDFEMVNLTPCQVPLGRLDGYYDSFWRRLGDPSEGRPARSEGPSGVAV